MKPPPTPIIADSIPVNIPTANGGIAEIYNPDVLKRILSGKVCTRPL